MLSVLFFVLVVVGFVYFLNLCIFLLGGNIHDVLNYKRMRERRKNPVHYNPLVTVVIPAYNEEKVIQRCIESVLVNTYKNVEIIVVDDGSPDRTSLITSKYSEVFGERKLRLVTRTLNRGKAAQLTYVLEAYARGEIVMTLDADSMLAPEAIERGVAHFANPEIQGLASNVRIMEDPSALNLLQIFEYMVSYRTKKFFTLTNSEFIIGGVGSMYRMDTMREFGFYDELSATEDIALSMKIAADGNKKRRLIYAMDVIAYTESVPDLPGLLRQRYRWKYGSLQNLLRYTKVIYQNRKDQSGVMLYYRVPMAYFSELLLLLEPFLITFAIYLSVVSGTITLFFSAYMMLLIYLLIILWLDEHISIRSKAIMSFFVPVIYFLFYIMSYVQVAAAIKVLSKSKELLQAKHSSKWVSPTRTGRAVSIQV